MDAAARLPVCDLLVSTGVNATQGKCLTLYLSSNLLFMAAVGFFFAPLAPLVAVACAVVFWVSSWVYKYQLMFVFVSKTESGGRMWNVVINRLLAGVILMQCIMILSMCRLTQCHASPH